MNIMKSLRILSCAFVFVAQTTGASILQFDDTPVAGGGGRDGHTALNPYFEDEFIIYTTTEPPPRFPTVDSIFIRLDPFKHTEGAYPNNGSNHLSNLIHSSFWLERIDGGVFSLESLDVAEYSRVTADDGLPIELTGLKENGEIVQALLPLDGVLDGYGGVDDFQNYEVNWNSLVRVEFASAAMAIDNIVVTPVPAPASIWLLLSGIVVLLQAKNRKPNNSLSQTDEPPPK